MFECRDLDDDGKMSPLKPAIKESPFAHLLSSYLNYLLGYMRICE